MHSNKIKQILFKIVAVVGIAQLSSCSEGSVGKNPGYLLDTAEIVKNIDYYQGKSVTVRNDIIKTVGERGFVLDQNRLLKNRAILAINIAQQLKVFSDGPTPEVLVSGRVEQLNLSSIKREYGVSLEADLYHQYEGHPVIIATSILLSPDPEDLTAKPEIYYDQPLAIKGEVDDVISRGVFELDEEKVFGGEDLLVLQSNSQIQLYEEQTVIVHGILRQFVAEKFEQDYDLDWDLSTRSQLKAEYDQKPVLVTEKIILLE